MALCCQQCRRVLVFESDESEDEARKISTLQDLMTGDESFSVLPVLLQETSETASDRETEFEGKLLQLASEESLVDQPVCEDCISRIMQDLDRQYDEAVKEREQCKQSLAELEGRTIDIKDDEEFATEIKEFKAAEWELRAIVEAANREHAELEREKASIDNQVVELDELEMRYWHDFNQYKMDLHTFEDDRQSLHRRIQIAEKEAEKLRQAGILEDCFKIHPPHGQCHFATICGFRMGTTAAERVPWNEINAAWGQCALLLYTLSKKCNYTFSTYDVIPKGSYSYMLRRSDKYQYEL